MISRQTEAEILRLYHVEKWRVGTIAEQLGVHHDAVRRVLEQNGVPRPRPQRPSRIDAYLPFILETLRRYPKLPASRLYDMCRERGYRGSPDHFRHMIARHRPRPVQRSSTYLSYDSRYGDLLFEVISRRHENRSTVLTTNKAFSEWAEVFSNASCVTALIDRLVHRAEIVKIEGKSYREKEALERAQRRATERQARAKKKRSRSAS